MITQWLASLLAVSVLGNAALGWAYLGQRDKAITQTAKVTEVRGEVAKTEAIAKQCSDRVASLDKQAKAAAEAASAARAQAQVQADTHFAKADKVLMAPPPVPQDACLSAQARASEWLKERNP